MGLGVSKTNATLLAIKAILQENSKLLHPNSKQSASLEDWEWWEKAHNFNKHEKKSIYWLLVEQTPFHSGLLF